MFKTLSQKHSEFEKWKTYVLEEWTQKRMVRASAAYAEQKYKVDPQRYPLFLYDLLASMGRVEKKHAL